MRRLRVRFLHPAGQPFYAALRSWRHPPAANHAHLQFLFHISRFVLNEHMLSLFNDSVLSAMRRLPVYWSDPSWRITPQPMRTGVVFDLAAAPLAYKPR